MSNHQNKYSNYCIEDFIMDEDFIETIKNIDSLSSKEWQDLITFFPNKKEDMDQVFILIKKIKLKKEPVPEGIIEADLDSLQKRLQFIKQRRRRQYWISAAACVIILIASGLFYFYNSSLYTQKTNLLSLLEEMEISSDNVEFVVGKKDAIFIDTNAEIVQDSSGTISINSEPLNISEKDETEYIQLKVPYGKHSFIEFSDGSRAWINSGSKLIYPSRFDTKSREIFLEGEMYVEVKENKNWPFHVKTRQLDVEVLGTKFNVSAYADDAFSNVVLVQGSVNVTTNNKKSDVLTPNQCLKFESGNISISEVDTYNYICWKDNIMVLNNEPLSNIFKELSRYYNIKIHYDRLPDNSRYIGKITLTNSIDEVLRNLTVLDPITYTKKEDGTIEIKTD